MISNADRSPITQSRATRGICDREHASDASITIADAHRYPEVGVPRSGSGVRYRVMTKRTRRLSMRADPGKALDAFNALCGPYAEDDLYVFVISIREKLVRANGADPRLIGIETDALSLRASGGKFVREMIATAGQRDQGEMDYAWPNPVTGTVENKHVFLRKVDDMVIGVGFYAR
jgi:cytochrome c